MKAIKNIESVTLIGSGNVATVLGRSLHEIGINIVEVYSKNLINAESLAKVVNANAISDLKQLKDESDLYLISVSDDKIEEIASLMPLLEGIIVHTSGSKSIDLLSRFNNKGIFYPLQTITKDSKPDIREIPICIESYEDEVLNSLKGLAGKLTDTVVNLSSEQRLYLHMTAVIVNNFTNFMYGMAHELLEDEGIDFSLLIPLIQETAKKTKHSKPHSSQTGPARRKDELTIKRHLELLDKHPEYQNIYRLLSEQLIKKYHE